MKKKLFRSGLRFLSGLFRRFHRYTILQQVQKVGKNFICDKNVVIYGGENIIIGNDVVLNKGVILQSCEGAKISIGNNVTLSYDVKLLTGNLNYLIDSLHENRKHNVDSIYINNNVWVGSGSIILPGVKVVKNVVIAAGSVVTKSIEKENAIYGGNPAKFIKPL